MAGRDPIAMAKRVTALDAMSRFFVLGLKFFRVSRGTFMSEFGMPPEDIFGDTLEHLVERGMLDLDGDDYVLTRTGRYYSNNVSKEFFTGENRGQRQHVQFVPTITPEQISYYANLSRGESSAI